MKHLQFLLLTFFFTSIIVSQEVNHKEIDSLLVLLNTKQVDAERVNTYSEICEIYRFFDLNKANEYNDKMLEFSKKNNNAKGIGLFNMNKATIFIDSEKYSEALALLNNAVIIFRKIDDKQNYIRSLNLKAASLMKSGNVKEAEKTLKTTLNESEKINYTKGNGYTYFLLGNIYINGNKLNEAMINYQKAIIYYRKINKLKSIVLCYRDISYIYNELDQPSMALKCIESAIMTESKLKTPRLATYADLLAAKGVFLVDMKKYSKGLPYLNKSLQIHNRFGNKGYISDNLFSISKAYCGLKLYNNAINTCNKGLKLNNEDYLINFNYLLGKIYFDLKNYKKSLFYQKKAVIYINSKDYHRNEVSEADIFEGIRKTEFALGNFKQAYLYQEKYSLLEKQSLLDEKKDRINELQTRFDVNEKEIALKNLTISKQKRDIEFQKEKNKLMISSIVLGSTIILLGFISFGYKKNIKKNKVLKEQNQIITTKNIEIETTQGLLVKSLKEKEVLLKEIHHRVKNNLQLVMSLLNIQARQGDYFDINDFLEKGQSRIASMALIHQNIYQTENLDRVDFQEYLVNLVENLKNSFSGKQGNIDFSINAKDIYFDIETSIPLGLVINELVCNALKHAFPDDMDGKISIELNQKENNDFELTIRDNGIGIEKTVKSKKSLGLELVNLLVAQLKGKINIESIFGTDYTINFQEIRV